MKNLISASVSLLVLAACASAPSAPAATPEAAPEVMGAAAAEPAAKAWNTLTGERPIVIAHRGASGLYPEHTIMAYKAAIAQGADFIEPDLVMTSDGVLIARHDLYLSATTDIADHPEFADRKIKRQTPFGEQEDWWADDFTFAEIQTLKARQQFQGRAMDYNDQLDIVTFDEIMDLVLAEAAKGRIVGLHVEAKWPGHYTDIGKGLADPILDAMKAKGLKDAGIPVYIQCFEPPFLAEVATKSDLPLIQNMVGAPYAAMMGLDYKLEDITTDGVGADVSYVLGKDGKPTDFVERAHEAGLLVHVYTVRDDRPDAPFTDSRAELQALFEAGIDGVWADFPGTAVEVRDSLED
jgi:glycerophosphoryl diester phosphodiesterase